MADAAGLPANASRTARTAATRRPDDAREAAGPRHTDEQTLDIAAVRRPHGAATTAELHDAAERAPCPGDQLVSPDALEAEAAVADERRMGSTRGAWSRSPQSRIELERLLAP
jgi:hypothetical protein